MQLGIGLGLNRLGGRAPGFSPSDLAGLEAWWDASDLATITEASGRASQWDDKSGNGRHLTQATGAAQPYTGSRTQNGLNVMDFQNAQWMEAGDTLDVVAYEGVTQMAVYKSDVAANHTIMGKSRAGSGAGRYSLLRETTLIALFQDSVNRTASAADSSTAVRVVTQRMARATTGGLELFRDNVLAASDNTVGLTAYDTGDIYGVGAYQNGGGNFSPPAANLYLDGFIAEAFVWNRPLTDFEMDVMHAYLNDKWGI